MRPVLAIVVSLLVLGSVKAYMLFQRSLPQPAPVESITSMQASGSFSIDVTLTFDAVPDEFAFDPSSALIQLQGKDLFRSKDRIAAGTPLRIENIDGIVEGSNSFYIKIAGSDDGWDQTRAVRVRVLRDGVTLAEQTLWSEPGAPVEGTLDIIVPHFERASEPHEH